LAGRIRTKADPTRLAAAIPDALQLSCSNQNRVLANRSVILI
jgi:hypothetical protein